MSAPIVFLDTETTSLGPNRLPWEVAMIRYDEGIEYAPADGGPRSKFSSIRLFIDEVDLSEADRFALDVGKYYERHPRGNGAVSDYGSPRHPFVGGAPLANVIENEEIRSRFDLYVESEAMVLIEQWTRGATVVGANPAFDTELLGKRLRWHNLLPSWHHRLVDVEALTAGKVGKLNEGNRLPGLNTCAELLGVTVDPDTAHTALGDALLTKDVYEAILGPLGFAASTGGQSDD